MAHPKQDEWDKRRERTTALCRELGQEYPRCGYDVGAGWEPHVEKALRKIAAIGIPWSLQQVKQKFCQLRIYVDFPDQGPNPMVMDFIGKDGIRRFDVPHPDNKELRIWNEGHPDHGKYLEAQAAIAEAEQACNTACEGCGAPAGDPGPMSGCRECGPCRKKRIAEYEDHMTSRKKK